MTALRRRVALPSAPLVLLLACAPERPPHAEPGALDFSPRAPTRTLHLVNPSDAPVSLRQVRLDVRTPDWGSFVITDGTLPTEVPPHGEAEIHLAAVLDNFADPGTNRHERRFRSGQSRLLLALGDRTASIPLRFGEAPEAGVAEIGGKLGVYALALAALVVVQRRRRAALSLPLVSLLALALTPVGDALCLGSLGEPVSARDVARCAEGYGGAPLHLAQPTGALLFWLGAIALPPLLRLRGAPRNASPAAALRLAIREGVASLALVAAIGAAALSLGASDPRGLVLAQEHLWGLVVQPFGALAFLLSVLLRRPPAASSTSLPEDLALASFFVVAFAGGWWLPWLPFERLPHAAAVALQIALTLAKIGATHLVLARLRSTLRGRVSAARTTLGLRLALVFALVGLAFGLTLRVTAA